MISDVELVTRVTSSDDPAAFQILVERHQSAIRGFLGRLTAGDFGTADDLAQETFLLAYRKIHTLKSSGSFVSWLHTIAYRRFLQFTRQHGRQRVMAEPPEQSHDPRQSVDAEILAHRLLAFVSAEERVCLTLAYSAGMSHPEIGEVTELPLGTVKSHIQRGKQKLQRWVKDHDHSIPGNKQHSGTGPEQEAQSA
ncbi:MAG: RNA polymerase sigma factor [Gammaproteobacteria bacterium]|nr:RNA polymerase sigma factor [Gammaproteobacteria bacterium]